jgi:glucose/arabinose dehydrogenase
MAFSPTGELWEVEHGPRGGDELNLIEKGKNYGWPLVSYGENDSGVPIPKPDSRPDLAKPVLYWVPVIAPGNLMFYRGTKTSPQGALTKAGSDRGGRIAGMAAGIAHASGGLAGAKCIAGAFNGRRLASNTTRNLLC